MPLKPRSRSLENIYGSEAHRAIYSEIAIVKRRIKLVEGERRANYELNEEELKKNEVIIEELRKKIFTAKKECEELRKTTGDYSTIIASHLGDDKKVSLFRGKTFEETEEILESLIGDSKNRLNLVKYRNQDTKQKLQALTKEEKQLERVLFGGNKNVQPMLKELRQAENNGALMEMRITEAENIQTKYKIMLETLKQENYIKGNQLRTMENTILAQRKEELKLKETLIGAVKAHKAAREKLTEVEEQSMKAYADREEKLMEARLQLRVIREQMEEIGNKLSYHKFHMAHRDSSLAEGLYFHGTATAINEGRTENMVERVYQSLVEMTGESDPVAIIARFEQQRTHAGELEKAESELKSRIRREKLRKRFLQDKLTQLQFSGGIKRELLDKEIAEINDTISTTQARKEESEKKTEELKQVLEESMKKLSRICTRNLIPEVIGIEMSTGDRVLATLKILFDRVEESILEQDNIYIFPSSPLLSPESESQLPTFSYDSPADLVLENSALLGVRSRRTSLSSNRGLGVETRNLFPLPSSSRVHSAVRDREFGGSIKAKSVKQSESSEDEEAASRGSIKRQSQQMVEAKTRKGRYKVLSSPGVSRRPSH